MRSLLTAASLSAVLAASAAGGVVGFASVAQAQSGSYQIEFATGSAELDSAARQVVSQAAGAFRSGDGATIQLVGHADTTGSESLNQRLSEERAQAVRTALQNEGVSPASIQIDAVGENSLIVQTADGVSQQANRVVTINVRAPVQAAAPPSAPVAMAADEPEKDNFLNFSFELGPYYGYDFDRDNNLLGGNLSADYRINEYISFELEQAVFWIIDDNGLGARSLAGLNLSTGPLVDMGEYGKVIPYVGANAGFIYGDKMDDDFIYGPEIGIDLGFVTAKVSYDIRDTGFNDGVISATIGGLLRF